jgi:hypothetical protein
MTAWIMVLVLGATAAEDAPMVKFEKQRIGDVVFEAASAIDVNNDGVMDIVTGGYWFEGPDFTKSHKICDVAAHGDYFDDFGDIPLDVNGDGFVDIVSGAWFGKTLTWRENPKGQPVEWQVHLISEVGNIERPCCFDIDQDGTIEIIPNTPGGPVRIFKLVKDADGKGTGKFEEFIAFSQNSGHGMGFGDINGDGRPDIVLATGWLEAPEKPLGTEWAWHPEFNLGSASIPVLVHDVNGDGLNDLIVGQGHDFGLAWWEQKRDGDGNRSWVKHDIDTERSQYHDLQLADIDNDGNAELITGKRYHAHSGHDPGGNDPVGLYYFEINGGEFVRRTIDYGDPKECSGAGIYFWIADLDGNGWKDIIAPGKEGVYLFRNLGNV